MSYKHTQFEARRTALRWLIHNVGYRAFARFEGCQNMDRLPESGPAIVMFNHIGYIDPIIILSCLPRNAVPMGRHDVVNEPGWGIFPELWGFIPVRRDEVDRTALRMALDVLKAGEVVLLAPEGTRGDALRRGKVGVAYLATRSGATVLPVAVEGTTQYPSFQRDLPGASASAGRPFRYRSTDRRPRRDELRLMTDEAMYVLAALLPEQRRGVYSDLSKATSDTIEFLALG